MAFKAKWTPAAVTSIYIFVLFGIFLFAVGRGGYTTITEFKFFCFTLISALYLLALISAIILHRHEIDLRSRWSAVHTFLLLFLLFTAVSAVASPFFPGTLLGFHRKEGLLTVACYLLCFFGVSLFGEIKTIHLKFFTLCTFAFCVFCSIQFLGLNPLGFYPEGLNYYDGNVAYRYEFAGTVGNVDLVGAYLSLAGLVLVGAFVEAKGKDRCFYLIALIVVWATALYIKVAAVVVALFGGTLLLLPLVLIKNTKVRKVCAVILILFILFALLLVYCADIGEGTLHEGHELLHGRWDDHFGTGRLFIWRNVMTLVPERPLFGGGCDTLGQRMTEEFERYDAETGVTYRAVIDAAHNEYLNILVNEGALALIAYSMALLLSFYRFIKTAKRSKTVLIWGCGVAGYAISAFFGIRVCITAPFFFLCWAMMTAAVSRVSSSEKSP